MHPLPKISKKSVVSFLTFLFLVLLGRFLFPLGDEPDYSTRLATILNYDRQDGFFRNMIRFFYSETEINPSGVVLRDRFSLYSSIPSSCIDNMHSVVRRSIITACFALTCYLPIIFRKHTYMILKKFLGYRLGTGDYDFRCDLVLIGFLLPSSIYYTGVAALEQIVVFLSFWFILFFDSFLLMLLLILLVFSIDQGNAFVWAYCGLAMLCLRYVYSRFGGLFWLWLSTLILLVSYLLSIQLVNIIAPFFGKAAIVYEHYSTVYSDVYTKYPLALRPAITFMTFVFMTPSLIKVPFLYVVFFLIIFIFSFNLYRFTILGSGKLGVRVYSLYSRLSAQESRFIIVSFMSLLVAVVTVVFILPGYAHYKYYTFLSPFFMIPFFYFRKGYWRTFAFICIIDCLFFVNILAYYVFY